MDTRPEGLGVNGVGIKFRSLSLGGVRGKVRATLNENQVSFESRNGHALDIRLNAIKRVHHHDTNLVPGWLAVVGLILVWVAWRGVTGKIQALLGAAGIVLSAAHYFTKQPTLIIDTNADDCHVVFGPDLSIMRLCALIKRLQDGMSLDAAKASVDSMVSDSDYPRSVNSEELAAIPEPVELFPSAVINHFIDTMEMDEEILDAELESPATVINDLDIPGWEEEVIEDPQISEGLLARSKANLFTQRNQVMQNGWQEPPQQPVYNQVHRATPTGMPSYEMLNQNGQRHSFNQQTQPQPTPPPSEFLPSFVGASGAHVPHSTPDMFSSPDTPLQPAEELEEVPSLVASARREVPLEAEIIPEEIESPRDRYPKMSKLVAKPKTNRLRVRKSTTASLRGRSVIAELVSPTLGRASRISKRIFRGRSRTTDSLRLQSESSRQSQVAESIQNLAKSNGGSVSDEQLDHMLSHIAPKPDIPTSFSECVSTEKKRSENVESIPRIDD